MAQLTNKVKDHFLNPRNVGKIETPSAIGTAGTPGRGSGLRLFLRVGSEGKIERITYQIFNNAPAIAPASAFTELAIGKSTDAALEITEDSILAFLDTDKANAGNLRFDVIEAYASALRALHGEEDPEPAAPPADAPKPVKTITAKEGTEEAERQANARPKLIVMQLIQDVLDSEIRPAVAMDGGDVELVDVEGKQVMLRLHGHCVGCSSSNTTMRFFIEDRLRELVDPGLEVVDVTQFEGETHAPPGFLPV
ncbi:MAG: NifU family protein [Planctomycetes bacterium]|nr:NifU family protein [Planctomycetota bacterium]